MEFLFILLVVMGVIALIRWLVQGQAQKAYLESLERLKCDPDNADLQQATLALGRNYAQVAEDVEFNEQQLLNEIHAASAGNKSNHRSRTPQLLAGDVPAVNDLPSPPRPTPEARQPAVAERLARLEQLRTEKSLSEQEYRAQRQKLLDEL
jgi:hypothetical protein